MKVTLRELFLLTVIVSLSLGWLLDGLRVRRKVVELQADLQAVRLIALDFSQKMDVLAKGLEKCERVIQQKASEGSVDGKGG